MRNFTKKRPIIYFLCFISLFFSPPGAQALTTADTPVHVTSSPGSLVLDDNYEINIPGNTDTSAWGNAAVYAAQGDSIGILTGKTVTINLGDALDNNSAYIGILATEGGEVTFGKTTIKIGDTGADQSAVGIHALHGAGVTIGASSEITVNTGSWGGYGLRAENYVEDVISRITTGTGTAITSHIEGSRVVSVENYNDGGVLVSLGSNNVINMTQNNSAGIFVTDWSDDGNAAVKTGDYLSIIADGDYSQGLEVSGYGSLAELGKSADINMTGESSSGIVLYYSVDLKAGDGLKINMGGDNSEAVRVLQSSADIGNNAYIVTRGEYSYGLIGEGTGANLKVGNNAYISADKHRSVAVYAFNGASMDIGDSLKVYTAGAESFGLHTKSDTSDDGTRRAIITAGNELVASTAGDGSHALYAVLGLYGGPSRASIPGDAPDKSIIEVGKLAKISTTGKAASAVHASGFNSFITIGAGADISAAGEDSYAVLSHNGALTTLYGGLISVDMAHSPAAIAARTDLNGAEPHSSEVSGDSTVSGDGVFKIYGDIMAEYLDEGGLWQPEISFGEGIGAALVDMKLRDGSYFYGAAVLSGDKIVSYDINDQTSEREELQSTFINLTMTGASTLWEVTGNSRLTNLNMGGNATIDYRSSDMGTVILTENFGSSGEAVGELPVARAGNASGGLLAMKTDIAAGLADQLWISGTTGGSHLVRVYDSLSGGNTSDDTLILIQTADQGGSFKLANNNRVTIGAFDYELALETGVDNAVNETASGANWYLRGAGASDPGSDGSNIFSGAYLLSYAETETLIKRLGDLRAAPSQQGFWARIHGGKFESNAKSYVKGFDMDYGGIHVGYDRKLEIGWDGDAYAGIMFGYSKGDLDYSSHGSGEVDSKMVGLYSTFVKDNGFFLDLVLKYQWMENEFSSFTADGSKVTGDSIDTGGFGLSFEVGQRIHFGRGPKAGWYAEPQIQLTYMRQDGGEFYATDDLTAMRVGADGFTSIIGRLGLLIGCETEKSNLYFKVSRAREFDGDVTLMINDVPIKEDFGGSFWIYGLGYTAKLNDRNSIYLDIERTSGWTFRQAWSARLGWRMEF